MDIGEVMTDWLYEVENALGTMSWELNPGGIGVAGLLHYTGHGPKWTVQLVVLNGQRMATASTGPRVMKLPDALADVAARTVVDWLERGTR